MRIFVHIALSVILSLLFVSVVAPKVVVAADAVVCQRPKETETDAKTTKKIAPDTIITEYSMDGFVYPSKVVNLSIDTARYKSKLVRTINHIFSTSTPRRTLTDADDDDSYYEGFRIDSIIIIRMRPFNDSVKNKFVSWAYRTANKLHWLTRESKIRQSMIIKKGDKLSSTDITRNEVLIRSSNYVNDVSIVPEPVPDKDSSVVLMVFVRDNFSLGGELSYGGKENYSKLSVYENNLFGMGNRLMLSCYLDPIARNRSAAGDISHTYNNIFGIFADFTTTLGYGDKGDYFIVHNDINKNFITPKDYGFGVSHDYFRDMVKVGTMDSVIRVTANLATIWAGYSFPVSKNETSVYFAARYDYHKYFDGPFVNRWVNPMYHDNSAMLFSLGIYRERFYRGNLIYGFGRTEDIPYGFRVEAVGGYTWGRYDNIPYLGAKVLTGHRTKLGYFSLTAQWGGYMSSIDRYRQMITTGDLIYFTHLLPLRRSYYLRQFFNMGVSVGSNMRIGDGQNITFSDTHTMRDLSMNNVIGTTRLYLSPETVLFSPWSILGFRFSTFAYFDFGTLGYDTNPFRNDIYSTIGIGLRIRNEKLSFSAIQLRLSFMLKAPSEISPKYFIVSHEQRLSVPRFIATQPEMVLYQ